MSRSGCLVALVVVADGDVIRIERWRNRAVPFVHLEVAPSLGDAVARIGADDVDAVLVDGTGRAVRDVVEHLKPLAGDLPLLLLAPREDRPGFGAEAPDLGIPILRDGGPVDLCRALRHVVAECRRLECVRRVDRLEPVTGLIDREAFREEVAGRLRSTVTASAVLTFDLNGFAAVNDLIGRDAADRVLHAMSERLTGALEDGEILGCAGGGRFLLWAPTGGTAEQVLRRMRQLLDVVARPLMAAGQRLQLTASGGVALYPADAVAVDSLVARAEAAVYRAYASGPNTYRLHQPLLVGAAPGQLHKRAAVRLELDRDALELMFEPQLDLRTERPRAARLSLRTRSDRVPLRLSANEVDDLALPMIRWTLETAGAQMTSWLAAEVPLVPLVVDLPLKLVHRSDVVEMVRHRLQSAGCHPAWFEVAVRNEACGIDITDASTADHLQALRDLGLRVTLAGGGGRTSSWAALRDLPADGIELAAELVEASRMRPSDATILRALVSLALALGLEVGAAGVDRPGLARELKELGCDWATGAWVGAPMAGSAFSDWLSGGGTMMIAAS